MIPLNVLLILTQQPINPNISILVHRVTGSAWYSIGTAKEKKLTLGPVPNGCQLRIESGFVVVSYPLEAKRRKLLASDYRASMPLEAPDLSKNAMIAAAFNRLFAVGGSKRRGPGATFAYPLGGNVRAGFMYLATFPNNPLPGGEGTVWATFTTNQKWDLDRTPLTTGKLYAYLRKTFMENQKEIADVDFKVHVSNGKKEFETEYVTIIDKETEKKLDELLKIVGNEVTAEKCLVRAGIFNDPEFKLYTEAAVELEMAIQLEPDNEAAYWALAQIYVVAGLESEAKQVLDDLNRLLPESPPGG